MLQKIFENIKISLQDTLKNILKALISSFGILFLIAFLVLYLSLRTSIKDYISENLFGKLAINEIQILPGKGKRTKTDESSYKSIPISNVKKIRKMSDFSNVYSVIRLDYSSKVRGEMFGKGKKMYMPICGIEPAFFKDKLRNWKSFKNKKPVPIIAPKFALEMFNNYLELNGYSLMKESDFRGFPLEIHIKTTAFYEEQEKNFTIKGAILAFTDVFNFPGIIVPGNFITSFAAKHRKDSEENKKGYKYILLYAKVKDIKQLPSITDKIKKMGLTVESQQDIADKTNKALKIMDGSSLLIISIFLILTVISIFNSYLTIVYHRSIKFSLKRVLGISKIHIIFSFVLEALFIGFIYGLLGYYLGNYLLDYASDNAAKWIPMLKGITLKKGESVLLISLILSSGISALSALIPAIFASNINLFKAIRK